ncbi:MAG: TOMM precursor leader peptide-binding protein [Candidatus Nanopelagicales bacterium]
MSRYLPAARPGLPFLRRSRERVQVGLDPRTAVVIDRLSDAASAALLRLDGTLTAGDLAVRMPELHGLFDALHDRGLIADDDAPPAALAAARRERYADDLAALAHVHGTAGAVRLLARRARATVVVRGDDRAAAHVAVGLASAGIGTVVVQDGDRLARESDRTAVGPHEPGEPWGEQVSTAVRAQGARPASMSVRGTRPSAVVVCASADADLPWTDPELADDLLADGIPHLAVAVSGTTALVGPFVVPGATACLWCLDHRYRDADPAWPALTDQLRLHHPRSHASLGIAAAAAASLAVAQVLQVVDDGAAAAPATYDGQVELRAPDLLAVRRPVARHPVCGCGWDGVGTTMAS